VDEVDQRAVFAAAYGTHFVLELRERRAAGAELNGQLLMSVAHSATTVARGAIQGLRELARLASAIDDAS
jgi:hypothetical protein